MRTDALQVGQNLIKVKKLKDMPIMIDKINIRKVEDFFLREARNLENEIFK